MNEKVFNYTIIKNLSNEDVLTYWLIDSCRKRMAFYFWQDVYLQRDGLAIGRSSSPTLANTYLYHYKKECLNSCPSEFKPKVY